MLHSKSFKDIESALRFANDFNNKLIPISFVDVATDSHPVNNRILLVYEPIEIPKPGTSEQDLIALLKKVHSALDDRYYPILKQDIEKCLSSL